LKTFTQLALDVSESPLSSTFHSAAGTLHPCPDLSTEISDLFCDSTASRATEEGRRASSFTTSLRQQ
jgi:hypothetical protein